MKDEEENDIEAKISNGNGLVQKPFVVFSVIVGF